MRKISVDSNTKQTAHLEASGLAAGKGVALPRGTTVGLDWTLVLRTFCTTFSITVYSVSACGVYALIVPSRFLKVMMMLLMMMRLSRRLRKRLRLPCASARLRSGCVRVPTSGDFF